MRQDKQEAGNRRVEEPAQCNDWGWHEGLVKQCFEVDGMEDRFAASGCGKMSSLARAMDAIES